MHVLLSTSALLVYDYSDLPLSPVRLSTLQRCDLLGAGHVLFGFWCRFEVAKQSHLHEGENFTLSCRVTVSPGANVNTAVLKAIERVKAVVKVLVDSSVPTGYMPLAPNGASTRQPWTTSRSSGPIQPNILPI